MVKNWITLSIRRFNRNKANSFINILGLSLGMIVFLVIFIYVKHEFSYDNFHDHSDRIFQLIKENPQSEKNYRGINRQAVLPAPLAYVLKEQITGIERVARLMSKRTLVVETDDKTFYEESYHGADADLFDILTFNSLYSSPGLTLDNPKTVAISESTAIKYFGSTKVIGKVLEVTGTKKMGSYTVDLVFGDFPTNSSYQFNIILRFEDLVNVMQPTDLENWNNYNYNFLVKTSQGADPFDIEYKIKNFFTGRYEGTDDEANLNTNYILEPLVDLYLGSEVNFSNTPKNDINRLYMLVTIAIFVLVVAGINYVNLTTARSIKRAKEVGIRKVAGAYQSNLILQFLSDALTISVISMIIAMLSIWIIFPDFQSFIGKQIPLNLLSDNTLLFTVLGIPIVLGLLAGIYPAFVLSSFKPIKVLKGNYGHGSDGNLMQDTLTVFQFSISGGLILAVMIIGQQLHYLETHNPGYDREHILKVSMTDVGVRKKKAVFVDELLKNPNILTTSITSYFPNSVNTQQGRKWVGLNGSNDVSFYTTHADHNYIDLFNIKLVAGRNFSPDIVSDRNAFLINETAAKTYGWDDPIGMQFIGENGGEEGDTVHIIGVIKDIHISSYKRPIEPFRIGLANNWSWQLAIKINPEDMASTLAYIEENYKKLTTTKIPFKISFFDEDFGKVYKSDQQLGKLINLFSIVAIFIACLGLYALSVHNVTQRLKEIGIRKILGAKHLQISYLISRRFINLVIISFVFAAPIAYYIMDKWLQTFAYHITIGIGVFILTAIVMLLIALLTVGSQTWRAATANPTDVIRNE